MKFTKSQKTYVAHFKELRKNNHALVGGKGANLGELASKFNVPNGLVVSKHAFNDFIEHNKITDSIIALQSNPNAKLSKEIQQKVLTASFPNHVQKEIKQKLPLLSNDFVSVRSSAIFEDSGESSWAGQLETYLNIHKKDVLENVRNCWGSLFSDRVVVYYSNQKDKKNLEMAVVIQEMLNPEVSGVCFTVNPISKNSNELLIEAGFGLGESIVSGEITPDLYIVNKTDLTIEKVEINSQEKMLTFADGKTTEVKVSEERVSKQKLTGRKIFELAKKAIEIENHYSEPQDIEWALQSDELYFLQSRPITTLK